MFHVGVSSPYPVAIRVVKLYEAEAVTVALGGVNGVCVSECLLSTARGLEALTVLELNNYRQPTSSLSLI